MSDIILGPVKQWSFSRLVNFENCPYKVYLASVEKKKGPVRDDDHPAERGNKIHKIAEDFVAGKSNATCKEMKGETFAEDFEILKEEKAKGNVEVEGDWGFDINWEQTGWWDKDVWARIKLDVFRRIDKTTARVIDHKTGKKFGNEVKHTQQAQLYMVGSFLRYPELEMIETEFWYLDQNTKMRKTYTRNKLPLYLKKFTERALRLTTCTDWKAKPNKMNCKYCDFGLENGTGECPYAVTIEGS